MLTIVTTRVKNIFLHTGFLLLSSLFVIPHVNANNNIPDDLKKWQAWVLKDIPSVQCPILYNNNKNYCAYPDELSLNHFVLWNITLQLFYMSLHRDSG